MRNRRRILHLNAGNETGGGMHHIVSLLNEFSREEFVLGTMEEGKLQQRAADLHIQTVHFQRKLPFPAPLGQIKKYIHKEKIDIVHTHGPRANVFANLLRKWVDFSWIVTVHSNPKHDFIGKGPYGKLLESMHIYALKHADRMLLVSESFREKLVRFGMDTNKMITAQNGIDFHLPDKYDLSLLTKKDIGLPDASFMFLMAARLAPVKNHTLALSAFKNLLHTDKTCHLVIAGDGQEKGKLQQYVRQLDIGKYVHFLGEREDIDALYHLADVTLLTSISEGGPLVLLESARAKTPAITTNVGGAMQMIPNQSSGWVLTSSEEENLTVAMRQAIMLKEQGKLQSMGQIFYQHASTHFSVEKLANKVYNVYNTV